MTDVIRAVKAYETCKPTYEIVIQLMKPARSTYEIRMTVNHEIQSAGNCLIQMTAYEMSISYTFDFRFSFTALFGGIPASGSESAA